MSLLTNFGRMEVEDIIKAVAAATFTAGVPESVSVTREAGRAIRKGAMGSAT